MAMANNFHCIGFVSKQGMVNYQSDLPVKFKYDILDIKPKIFPKFNQIQFENIVTGDKT